MRKIKGVSQETSFSSEEKSQPEDATVLSLAKLEQKYGEIYPSDHYPNERFCIFLFPKQNDEAYAARAVKGQLFGGVGNATRESFRGELQLHLALGIVQSG